MYINIIRFDVLRNALIKEDCPNSTFEIKTTNYIVSDSFLSPIIDLLSEMISR